MKAKFIDDPDYIKICNGLDKGKRTIRLQSDDIRSLERVCTFALQNSPKAIGVIGFEFMMMAGMVNILPKYTLKRKEMDELIKKCEERRKKIENRCNRDNSYQTAVAVHDMLARNVEYRDDGKLSHSMAAPLAMKYGVCDGFSKAYKFLMEDMGVPCIVVSGEAQDPISMKLERHAWNMVQIDGRWCHVDVTFDTGIKSSECQRYDYFGLSDEAVLIDHVYDRTYYPNAVGDSMEYYKINGNYIASKKQLISYIKKNINTRDIVVKVGDNVPESDLLNRVTSALNEVLAELGMGCAYSYNYNLKQKVVQICL